MSANVLRTARVHWPSPAATFCSPHSFSPSKLCLKRTGTPAMLAIDCWAVPFSLPTSEQRGCAGGDWCEMRGHAGLEKREGREKMGLPPLLRRQLIKTTPHSHLSSIRMVFRAKSDSGRIWYVVAGDFEIVAKRNEWGYSEESCRQERKETKRNISVSLISVAPVSAHFGFLLETLARRKQDTSERKKYLRFLKRKGSRIKEKARGLHSARPWIKTGGKLVSESSKCETLHRCSLSSKQVKTSFPLRREFKARFWPSFSASPLSFWITVARTSALVAAADWYL